MTWRTPVAPDEAVPFGRTYPEWPDQYEVDPEASNGPSRPSRSRGSRATTASAESTRSLSVALRGFFDPTYAPIMTTTTDKTSPPTTIVAAFFGFLVSSVTALATAALLLGSRQEAVDALRSAPGTSLDEEQLQAAVTVTLAAAVGITLLVALIYLWLSFKLKAGRNWARVVLTVFTLLQVAALVAGQGSAAGYVSAAVAVVALVLSYLPASNAYIASVKRTG